jgi:hypothetical protein
MQRNEQRRRQRLEKASDGIIVGVLTATALSLTLARDFDNQVKAMAITGPIGGGLGMIVPELVIEPGLKMLFLLTIGNLAQAYLPPAPAALVTVGTYIGADLTHKYLTGYWGRERPVPQNNAVQSNNHQHTPN